MRLVAVLLLAAAQAPTPRYIPPPPPQPIPYSHKQHIAIGLECKNCHEMADPGDFAGLPATARCMACHSEAKKDSPAIRKLAEFHREDKPVPWARVYRIPDYVFFSHKEHVTAGKVSCEACHGPVKDRDVMRKERDTSMAACMECHRSRGASLDCTYCHDQR